MRFDSLSPPSLLPVVPQDLSPPSSCPPDPHLVIFVILGSGLSIKPFILMFGDILEMVNGLVDLVDRNLMKLFTDAWPPLDTGERVTHRVVYVEQRTYTKTVQYSSRRVRQTITTLSPRIPPSSFDNYTRRPKSPRKRPEVVNSPDPKRRNPIAVNEQRRPTWTRVVPPSTPPSSSSSPAVQRSQGERNRHTLVKPVRIVSPRHRAQSFRLDDIKPDLSQCDVLVIAVVEMEICKEIFAGWRAQLNLADARRNDKLELAIVSTVHKLDIGASAALHASHNLLRNYRSLIHTIERSLGEISQSRTGGSPFSSQISSLASNISACSRALTSYVKQMQERLRELVKDIEKTKESANRRALKRKIWRWLSKAFKALSTLLSAGGVTFALFHPLGLLESTAFGGASMLSGAAARLCDIVHDKYSETRFDEILTFLRDHIPESAKAAEIALTSFQACHRILQVELEVRKGKRSGWVSAQEAKRARGQWAQAEQRLHASRSQL